MSRAIAFAAALLAGILGACRRAEPAPDGGGAQLMRNLLRAESLEIEAGTGPVLAACRRAAERIAREHGAACRALATGEPGDPRAPRIVAGGPSDAGAVALLARLGIEVDAEGEKPSFSFRQESYGGRFDALVAVLEDPDRPGLPVTVLYANERETLARCVERVDAGWKPWVRIYRGGALSLEGPLHPEGYVLEEAIVDHEAIRARQLAGYRIVPARETSARIRAAPDVESARLDAYLASLDRAVREARRWCGHEGEAKLLEIFLHARPEDLSVCASDPGLSAWNPSRREVHALLAGSVPDDAGLAAARAVAEISLGAAAEPWIADGAAVFASGRWWGKDLEEWVARLRLGDLVPGIAALVDPEATATNSSHVILPLRGALFRFLLESRGEDFARSLWSGGARLAVETETDRAFRAWLDDLASRHRAALEARRSMRRGAIPGEAFLAAVGIEEPGGSAERGFGSAGFRESLASARGIGAGAAVLTCFVPAQRDPVRIADLEAGGPRFGPFESDLRVVAGLCQARASGMRTLLQPHLLTGPAGTLHGTGPQGDETGWKKYFDDYGRFAVHAGLLCEIADADGLILGGGTNAATNLEVGGQSGTDVQAGWRREGWSRVLALARGAFSGSLTWAAESSIEARGIPFWDELDAVGCDLEAALDERELRLDPKPGSAFAQELGYEVWGMEELARKHGKGLILTRAGFRSGAARPGRTRSDLPSDDPGLQAFQLDVLGNVLRQARAGGVLRGVVLWRWSSDPADHGVNGRDGLLRAGPARDAAARALTAASR